VASQEVKLYFSDIDRFSYMLHMLHWNMLLLTLEAFQKFDNLICPHMMAQTEAQLQRGQSILKCTNKIALHLADISRKM
jgi:hypothetical protein